MAAEQGPRPSQIYKLLGRPVQQPLMHRELRRSLRPSTATSHVAKTSKAFTIAELLVSVAVLAVLVLLVSRLFSSAASVATLGNKRMDMDAQLRPLFDRMAIDFAAIVKRP